jgi:integration host factor subunit beta
MTKAELVEDVAEAAELTKKDAERLVEIVFESIIETLNQGEKIELRGFGSFRVRERGARRGRNPKTGDPVDIPAKRVPYFKPGKEMKELINEESASGGSTTATTPSETTESGGATALNTTGGQDDGNGGNSTGGGNSSEMPPIHPAARGNYERGQVVDALALSIHHRRKRREKRRRPLFNLLYFLHAPASRAS